LPCLGQEHCYGSRILSLTVVWREEIGLAERVRVREISNQEGNRLLGSCGAERGRW